MSENLRYAAPPSSLRSSDARLLAGIVALAFWGVGALLHPELIFRSYLVGYLFGLASRWGL